MTESTMPPTPLMPSGMATGCRASFAQVAALNTVRSAPVSTRNSLLSQEPLPVRISPLIMGRITPSSLKSHWPSIRIDARYLLPRDIAYQDTPLLFRMGCSGLCQDLFGRVRDEQFFACHTDALAAILRINLCGVPLQPGGVARK